MDHFQNRDARDTSTIKFHKSLTRQGTSLFSVIVVVKRNASFGELEQFCQTFRISLEIPYFRHNFKCPVGTGPVPYFNHNQFIISKSIGLQFTSITYPHTTLRYDSLGLQYMLKLTQFSLKYKKYKSQEIILFFAQLSICSLEAKQNSDNTGLE